MRIAGISEVPRVDHHGLPDDATDLYPVSCGKGFRLLGCAALRQFGEILTFCAKHRWVPILPNGLLLLSSLGRSTIRLFAIIGAFASNSGVILSAIGALAACGGVIIAGVSVSTLGVSVATLIVSVATLIISTSISIHDIYFLLLSRPLGLHPKRQVGRPGLFFDTHLIRRASASAVVDVPGRHVCTKQKEKNV
jgi:hypothetical protein